MSKEGKRSVIVRQDNDPLSSRLWRYMRYGASCFFYLNRPDIWPAIARQVADKLTGRIVGPAELREMKRAGTEWCARRAVSTKDGLKTLGIESTVNVRELYSDVFIEAEKRAGRIPVWMGGGSNLDLLYTMCRSRNPEVIVETGVANGWSSLAFLLYIDERKKGFLNSVDLPLLELHNDPYVGIAVPEDLKSPWTLHRMADREALPKILQAHPTIDLAYYDSDKSTEGRLFGYGLLWKHLRPGGILISDDVADNLGFASFCEQIGVAPIVVAEPDRSPQGILIKPSTAGRG